MQFSKILQITEGFVLLCLGGPVFLFSVPERGAAALKVTAHCTDLRKRNCLGVPERGRKLLVRAAAVRHVVRLRPRCVPYGRIYCIIIQFPIWHPIALFLPSF